MTDKADVLYAEEQIGRRVAELGADVRPPDVEVDTFGYDVGVFALLAFNGKIETDRAKRRRRRQRRLKPKPRRPDPTAENE